MSATSSQLSKEARKRLADRINYFRTLPNQILKSAIELEAWSKPQLSDMVRHDIRSVMVSGRVMLLNCSQEACAKERNNRGSLAELPLRDLLSNRQGRASCA